MLMEEEADLICSELSARNGRHDDPGDGGSERQGVRH